MTFILFAVPKFIYGLARSLDIGGTFDEYNTCDSAEEADYVAISSDWKSVGRDIKFALDHSFIQENK